MGVRHLQSFICSQPGGYVDVDINHEIKKWKRNHGNQPPIIVFDTMGLISTLMHDKKALLCGLRNQINLKLYEDFFKKLHDQGVKMIFFCDGPVQDVKFSVWCNRQHNRYMKTKHILNQIYYGWTLSEIILNNNDDIPQFTAPIVGITYVAAKYGEYIMSFENECDLEIAEYATKNNALAIIGNDTDFLIYSGDWEYWSATDLNLKTLQTKKYDRNVLQSVLRLSEKQLPLLATIGGNDIMPFDEVKHFHYRLVGRNSRAKFSQIANFIKSNGFDDAMNLTHVNLISIAKSIYYPAQQPDFIDSKVDLIKESINTYNLSYTKRRIDSETARVLQITSNQSFISILLGKPYNFLPPAYNDMSRLDMMSYHELNLPIFEKSLGILLKHKNDPTLTRKCYIKIKEGVSVIEKNIKPLYPEFKIPELQKLLNSTDKDQVNDINFKLICWLISEKLKPEVVKVIPKDYFMDTITTFYLVEMNQLTVLEADAILLTLDKVVKDTNCMNSIEEYPVYLNERTMRFCFLYMSIYNNIFRTMTLCGLKQYALPLRLDCVYLHKLVEHLKKLKNDAYLTTISEIKRYRLYVTSKNTQSIPISG